MQPAIDHSLYPDTDAPESLEREADAADYMRRVCGAYDFGIVPDENVLATLKVMRAVFDRYPMPGSPAYHALRRLFGWPAVPAISVTQRRADELDRREGREPDDTLI
jgi:hypothetical protein